MCKSNTCNGCTTYPFVGIFTMVSWKRADKRPACGDVGGENAHICGKWQENAYFMERIEGIGRTPLFSNKRPCLKIFFHAIEKVFSCLEKIFSSLGKTFSKHRKFFENNKAAAECLVCSAIWVLDRPLAACAAPAFVLIMFCLPCLFH